MSGPLDGVKVVELGVWVAGPGAGGILADWGADVTKVEPPDGDPSRLWQLLLGGDLDVNPPFELDNRGKRSIVLDLSTDDGRRVLHDLLAGADVFLTNIRAGALDRLGLGPDTLHEQYPKLIYALISGFGTTGDDAEKGAFDIAAFWARAGIAEALRPPDSPLPFQRAGMGDHSAAMTAAGMVSAALYGRHTTGEGQVVSTSLLRQGAYTIGFDVNIAMMWGRTLAGGDRTTMRNPTANNYTCADGRAIWIVGIDPERHFPPLARAIGRPEWLDDEHYSTAMGRATNAVELIAELDAIFATRSRDEWAEAFAEEPELFWAPVNTIDDLLADPQFHAAGAVVEVPDDAGGSAMLATPADFGGEAPRPRGPAPGLGQHTEEVLAELGYESGEVERLLTSGAAGVPATGEEA
ncbi:MAG: CoA transferase [Acidimicrobiales bacterium]|nr:CoA transferase [Acidimicrobiales bacterium]